MPRPPGRRGRAHGCWILALVLLAHLSNCHAQLSKPVAHDKHWQEQHNKFLNRKATNDKPDDQQEFDDIVGDQICPLDVELKWMTQISSSVYATPLITDMYADGRKDIIVPGFVHYTEVLEGPDGAKALGWPGFHKSTVHSSPLLYDIDSDGIRDVVVATYDGDIVFFKDNGEQLSQRLTVPRLRVRKNWYVGINPDPVDHSHPDVGKGLGADNPYEKAVHAGKKQEQLKQQQQRPQEGAKASPVAATSITGAAATGTQQQQQQQQQVAASQPQQAQQAQQVQQQQQQAHTTPPASPESPQQQQQPVGTSALLAEADKAAVLKFRQHLRDYAKEFGQPAADDMLAKVKDTNKAMYDAITAQIVKEKELEQLVGSFGTAANAQQQQQQQGQGQVPGVAHARRRLMSAGYSSSSSTDEGLNINHGRLLLQQTTAVGAAADGGTATPGATPTVGSSGGTTAGGGGAAGTPLAAGVESDPNQKPLTQEALDSFKIFDDTGTPGAGDQAAAAAGSDQQQQQQQQGLGGAQEPEDAAEIAAVGADGTPAGGTQQQQQGLPDQYPYLDDNNPSHEYDEFGDKLSDQAAAAAADQAIGATQRPQQQQTGSDAHGLHDFSADGYGGDERWRDDMWDDEMFKQASHTVDSEHVYIDPHILSTPAIADIDADGHDELVVAVSYFYDSEYYEESAHAHELQGIDREKYVAGGIVVFDLRSKLMKWHQHLDLTTATTKFTAHMFSAPTLVDIDACGRMEIVVGTSVGFVYVLNHKGESRAGWPVQMGEVQGQVLVADLNADGSLEIFSGDMLGNIALFDINGKEIWEQHVKSAVTQNAVAGDIDADGLLEIVFGTADGRVHAIRGTDGHSIPNFPFQTGGRINAPPTITHLKKGSTHQHILIMSFDGFLYLIDGKDGCAHTVDIGESSYSAVLADDLCGDGMLELLVSTMNGNVYMLQTTSPYHPAKTWTAQVQGVNGMVSRWGYFGFVATPDGRQLRDVAGQQLQVQVELWDQRTVLEHGVPMDDPPRGPYNVTVMLKGVGVAEMNAGPQPVIGVSDVLDKPGKAVIEIPCPRTRTTAAVSLDLTTKHGLHYQDEFVLSFHMHFHKLLKWLIALPLLAMAAVAVIVGQSMGFDAGRSYHLG